MTGLRVFLSLYIRILEKNIYKSYRKRLKPVIPVIHRIMEKIYFNSLTEEELRGMERKAWNGTLDFSKFPAPEYKFFDTVQALGYRCRHGNIPAELLKDDIRDARDIYRYEREQLSYNIEAQRKYHDARLRSRELVNAIYKTNTKDDKLRFALECIELLTGEGGFAARNLKYLEENDYGKIH